MKKIQSTIFRQFRTEKKYEILLISLLLLLFGDIFFHPNFDSGPVLLLQNVLASLIIFSGKKHWRLPLLILLAGVISVEGLNLIFNLTYTRLIFSLSYILYFVFLSGEVYRSILKTKEVTVEVISAVLCGFIMLALIGGYFFIIIEWFQKGSFNNLSNGLAGLNDLIYFSFITILTIGYGEITPASEIAKKASMLVGLLGHFYSVVVMGIIIGKFISKKE